MISFILDKNIIFIFFIWIYYYFCDAHNFGQILGMKTIQNISLYSRTYRLLSKFNNEKIKVSLELCPPLGTSLLGENSQNFKEFITESRIQAFLLSLFILSITMCNSDKSLYYKICMSSILNSRNNRILSKVKNKTINWGFKYKLDLKKNYYLENKKYVGESDCGERSASKKKYSSKFADKALVKKYMSYIYKPHTAIDTFFEKLLYRVFCTIYKYRKCTDHTQKKSLKRSVFIKTALIFALPVIIFLIASVIYILVQFFPETWKNLNPITNTQSLSYRIRENATFIALSLAILSVSMVTYTLVKFLKYVIDVRRKEVKT
ncbi:hypothetical protein MKS88_001774 [Plasmodium brasilianum]|uniref:Uncharacterized protein n=1 Tax=Plasmodium brasilianum TaxID=5824 RepID=A0ACB9YAR1_PLABR|nr:hypothetical protein MKS88_001774 [Plasmodium brasilianum]